MKKPKNGIVEFGNDGVMFNFGLDSDNIGVEKLSEEDVGNKSFVINVKVKEKVGNEYIDKTEFDPPLQLKVYYDQDDLDTAGATHQEIALCFREVHSRRWEKFTAANHGYKKEKKSKNNWLGHGIAMKISVWPDPVIAWGK